MMEIIFNTTADRSCVLLLNKRGGRNSGLYTSVVSVKRTVAAVKE